MAAARSSRTSTALIIVGAVFIWGAVIVGGSASGIIHADPFARRLAASLSDPRVSTYVSARITDAIVAQRPNLISVRTIIEAAVNAVVTSAPFRAVVRTSARAAHHSLFESAAKNVLLSLPDVSVLVRGALEHASPELAAKIPPGIETKLASPEAQRAFTRFIAIWALLGRILWAAWAVLVLGVCMLVTAIWAAPDRRRALVHAGGALFGVGLAILAVLPAGRLVAAAITPDHALRGVIHGLWVAYFHVAQPLAVVVCVAGVVLTAAGSTMLEALDPFNRLKVFLRWLAVPLNARAHIGRAVVLVAAGAYAALAPERSATWVIAVIGLLLLYAGIREVFRVVLARVPGATAEEVPTEARAWRIVATVGLGLAGALGVAAFFILRSPAPPPEATGVVMSCNGSPLLCDKPLDRVVFPAAHNAMSNAEIKGWLFPHHCCAFPRQLADGIRALAIDVHYGVPAGERVLTDMEKEGTSKEKIAGAIGTEATDAALRIRGQFLGHETGPGGMYFCHGFCELGAYPVVPALQGIQEFLVANPGEVVLIVVEDYVTPQDLAQAFQDAGLADLIYKGPLAPNFPTLRQLIDQNHRLVLFIETGRPGVDWLRPAFESLQETPYSFHKPEDFSCRPNRGGTTAPMFQINHWIETTPAPRPSNAEIVNAYDFLLKRARTCQEERHKLPNIIQVDFYDVGDLFRVVRTLNGLDYVAP